MKIGHVHLKVRDLNRSEEFYIKLLRAKQTERLANQYSFLTMGSSHHEFALQEIVRAGKSPEADMVGLYHAAFEVETSAELLQAIEYLEVLGVEYAMVDHGISWAVYTQDPDGNGVEVYLDRRDSQSGKKVWGGISRGLTKHQIANG